MTLGDFFVSKKQPVDPIFQEVAVMKQLILERSHPLELIRELISNAGAQEVGARNIYVTYYVHPEYGHAFEVNDDGCGMNFTNSREFPGRLDRFLGLGFSAVAGLEADEFSWKGIGSKLTYHSRRIEIETSTGKAAYSVVVNEPWQTIEDGKIPRPQVGEMLVSDWTGTRIKVFGHPPYKQSPFTFEEIYDYLLHRTFVGYSRERKSPSRIILKVQTRSEEIPFGFPEFKNLPTDPPEGTVFINPPIVVSKNLPSKNQNVTLTLKGFYTWDEAKFGLAEVHLNTGLILSVKGIPYFKLDMRELGSGQLAVANPGINKCCLIVECDSVQSEMNISRSGLVASEKTELFKKAAAEAIQQAEISQRHRDFRLIPKQRKDRKSAGQLKERKLGLESKEQKWVYWQSNPDTAPIRLMREPENETDTLAVLWKLEALNALPFANFESLAYSGTGADLVVHFQEDESSNSERFATFEAEYKFFNYKAHGHLISQFPTVICWEVNQKPKVPVRQTPKPYKYVVQLDETTLRIFALSKIPNLIVATDEEFARKKNTKQWVSNL